MTGTETSVRLFISHKPEDAEAAHGIADAMQVLGQGRLSVFVSEDPPEGLDFFTTRLAKLAQADTLLLLYSDPSQDWNVCVYESGFFSGRSFPDRTRRLIVMHDEDVPLPHPLNRFQDVAVSKNHRMDIERFISQLFTEPVRDGVEPISAEIMSDRWKSFRTVLEDTIIDAVKGPQETKIFVSEIAIDVPEMSLKQNEEAKIINMPGDARVFADPASFALFGLRENPKGYAWADFYREMDNASDNTQEWTDSLVSLMVTIAFSPKLLASTGLPLYRSRQEANNRGYRPAVRSFRRQKNMLSFRVTFVDLPHEVTLEESGAATTLAQALTLGRIFRWGVFWPFRKSLDSLEARLRLSPNEDMSVPLARDYSRFLENTLTAYVEGRNRGYQRDELTRCFEQNGSRKTLEGLFKRWDVLLAGFKDLSDKFKHREAGIDKARQMVNEAIDINKKIMILCAQRYKEALEAW
jgi:hypothetical protein